MTTRARILIAVGSMLCAIAYVAIPRIVEAGGSPVHEQGYVHNTMNCKTVSCSTVGDGGIMGGYAATACDAGAPGSGDTGIGCFGINPPIIPGSRYVSTVTTDTAVSVMNGSPCNSFGAGRILNEGSVFDWIAKSAPDGGMASYSCCAKSGTGTWQLCPIQ